MFRFASSKSVSLHDIHSQSPRQSLFFCCHNLCKSEHWTGRCALDLLLPFLPSVKPGSRWSSDRRTWIRIAGTTWNCGRKDRKIVAFLSCSVGPPKFIQDHFWVWMLSELVLSSGLGGREVPEKSVLETSDGAGRDLCAGWENMGWTLKFLYIVECEEKKAEPKSYSLNFCTLKVFLLVLLFLYLGAGGWCLFF